MKLYRSSDGIYVEDESSFYRVAAEDWDELLCSDRLFDRVRAAIESEPVSFEASSALAPIAGQEVWAAGVTYYRSRSARMEESKDTGGGTFYDRVYAAERPELFFKSAGWRAVGPGGTVRIRKDAKWSVPEPELTLVVNARGQLVGYTIGNDISSRDIEGENPLYVPQAKVYDQCCALGPVIAMADDDMPALPEVTIHLTIERQGARVFEGATTLAAMARSFTDLVAWLGRDNSFPDGAVLLTGTGIVPPDSFALSPGDLVTIEVSGIGRLQNLVKQN